MEFIPHKGAGLQGRDSPERPGGGTRPDDSGSEFNWRDFWQQMEVRNLKSADGAKYVVDTLLDKKNTESVPGAIRAVIASSRKNKKTDAAIVRDLKAFTDTVSTFLPDATEAIALLRSVPKPGLRNKPKVGTCFLIGRGGKRRWMATCAHLVKDAEAIRVDFSATDYFRVVEMYVDVEHDQALLLINADAPPSAISLNVRDTEKHGLLKSEFDLRVLGFVGMGQAGTFPAQFHASLQGKHLVTHATESVAPETEVFQLGVVNDAGSSGSPILDSEGLVVGIFAYGHNGRNDIGYGISGRYIKELDKQKKTVFDPQKSHDLVDSMIDYTNYIKRISGH
jgi:S1-C subfamily serine protease